MTDDQIKAIFLANGFSIKEGNDLRPYVYQAARALLAAAPQPPVGEDVEVDWPEYHTVGMGCGLEDRGITDRYEAMRYGWDEAVDRCALEVVHPLIEHVTARDQQITALQARVAKLEREAMLFKKLRDCAGYIENGGGCSVKFYQDDATRTWTVEVGRGKSYFADTLSDAIRLAHLENNELVQP